MLKHLEDSLSNRAQPEEARGAGRSAGDPGSEEVCGGQGPDTH